MSGQEAQRASIADITNAVKCIITTQGNHGYETGNFVRLTDLNSAMPVLRGSDQLNDHKFKVEKIDDTSFYIKDVITDRYVDSTNYTPYVIGGNCNIVQTNFIYSGE